MRRSTIHVRSASSFGPSGGLAPAQPRLAGRRRFSAASLQVSVCNSWKARTRRGLAPLELVLCLFFFLVMMALIINFGTTAPWHIRGQIVARNAAWRTLRGRAGAAYPNPSNWWPPATMGAMPPIALNNLPNDLVGQTWNQGDPHIMEPAFRGPVITDQNLGNQAKGKQIQMNDRQYLEMVNQAVVGTANLTKAMPLISNLRKANINPMHAVLDHQWRYSEMGFGYNDNWRINGWYRFKANELGDSNLMNLYLEYQLADQKLQQNPGIRALQTLDRDNEFPPWGLSSPDVYPTVAGCDASPQDVAGTLISGPGGLIDRIGGVPRNLAQAFIGLYTRQIQYYKSQQPPNQAMIQQLQNSIQQLQQVP